LKLLKRLLKQLGLYASLGVLLAGCAICGTPSGPKIVACIVDSARLVYTCADDKKNWDIHFDQAGTSLGCTDPKETENYLFECHRGNVIKINRCFYSPLGDHFNCISVDGKVYFLTRNEVDGFICTSDLHKKRIEARCGTF
jgi:hypothetical protein